MKVRSQYRGGSKTNLSSFIDEANIDPSGELLLLWPTPIYLYRHDPAGSPWHDDLRNEISRRSSVERTFRADWKRSDFFTWSGPGMDGFRAFLREHVRTRIAFDVNEKNVDRIKWDWNGWVNILPKNGWHQPHIHEKSTLSFIYYIQVVSKIEIAHMTTGIERGEAGGGILQFADPRGAAPYMAAECIDNVSSASVRLCPAEGLLCIFPSFLSHFVAPNTTSDGRISIAGNVFGIKV